MKTASVISVAAAASLTGNEFCSWAFVHRAAKRLPMEHELALEKRLTQMMIGPMALWMFGALAAGIWLASASTPTAKRYAWAGTTCYAAMISLTLAGNMPLNAATLRASADMDSQASAKAGVTWNVAAEAEGWAQALHFAALGVGVGLVNGCVALPPGTVARPVRDLPAVTYSALFLRADQASPAVRRLLETVQANLP